MQIQTGIFAIIEQVDLTVQASIGCIASLCVMISDIFFLCVGL